jgi:ribosomal protein S17E
MNTLIIVKISNVTFDEWKKKFDSDAEVQSKMMRNTLVGRVDENTAMISTEVFDQEMVGQFMTSDEFKKMEQELGLSHEVYQLSKT